MRVYFHENKLHESAKPVQHHPENIEMVLGILLMIYRKFLVNYMELERRK
jgi:hypothetical protein